MSSTGLGGGIPARASGSRRVYLAELIKGLHLLASQTGGDLDRLRDLRDLTLRLEGLCLSKDRHNDRLTRELVEKLRLILELRRTIEAASRGSDELSRDKVRLSNEIRRLQAFVHLLTTAPSRTPGGESLHSGEHSAMNNPHPCRGVLFFWVMLILGAFVGVGGGFLIDYIGNGTFSTLFGGLAVLMFVSAHIISFTAWGQKPLKVFGMLPDKPAPAAPAEIQQRHDDAELIRTRADGLDAKKQELADKRVELQAAQDELDRRIRQDSVNSAATLAAFKQDAWDRYDEYEAIRGNAASTQDEIDTAEREYNDAVARFGQHVNAIEAAVGNLRDKQDEIEQLVADIESAPGGLIAQVAHLQQQYDAAKVAEKAATDQHNAAVVAHQNRHYTVSYWSIFFVIGVVMMIAMTWDYFNVNKIIGDARVANGRDAGNYVSGDLKPAASDRTRYIIDNDKVQIGVGTPIVVGEPQPDGTIPVFVSAKLAEGIDWNRVVFYPMRRQDKPEQARK